MASSAEIEKHGDEICAWFNDNSVGDVIDSGGIEGGVLVEAPVVVGV